MPGSQEEREEISIQRTGARRHNFFTSGNKIPADARLIEAHHLAVNEAALTGESAAAQKNADILDQGIPLPDRDNMVYMGCPIESGLGKAV